MKLTKLRLSNFQSFSSGPTEIDLASVTYLLGPNGSGKTAALQALSRLFGFERSMRAIRRTDFHVSHQGTTEETPRLWIEAHFEFPELRGASGQSATIPSNFTHMKLLTADGTPCVRIRLAAEMDADGDIEEECLWVLETDASGSRSEQVSFRAASETASTFTIFRHGEIPQIMSRMLLQRYLAGRFEQRIGPTNETLFRTCQMVSAKNWRTMRPLLRSALKSQLPG